MTTPKMLKTPKKMVSFYCDPSLWTALKERSELTGLSIGWLARKAITEALSRWKDEDADFERFRRSRSAQPDRGQLSPQPAKPAETGGRAFRDKAGNRISR
jgi:hypothetical protein